jgi:hypothetical protein
LVTHAKRLKNSKKKDGVVGILGNVYLLKKGIFKKEKRKAEIAQWQ